MSLRPRSVLLVDDHPMMRRGLRQLLELAPDLRVVGEAGSGEEALALQARLQPELVLLDQKMPAMSGIDTLRHMRKAGYGGKVLLFTVSDAEDDVRAALRHGADGYLLKDMEPEQLVEGLRRVLAGEAVISERLAHVLEGRLRRHGVPSRYELTPRELDVLRQLAAGKSNRAIAEGLGIAEGTVKVHVKNLLGKLGMSSRVEAVIWAMENLDD